MFLKRGKKSLFFIFFCLIRILRDGCGWIHVVTFRSDKYDLKVNLHYWEVLIRLCFNNLWYCQIRSLPWSYRSLRNELLI
jgi:hypothetical protein